MCGFIASFGQNINDKGLEVAFDTLKRRGPDAKGIWKENDVFLGSRRLAIFDLHQRSNQPMQSICKRYLLVFNGAIYNYLELRKYLLEKGINLKTFSDTEVVVELFALDGPKMLDKLQGMFAFVIWDKKNKESFAARDPYGIKPLYIGYNSDGIILASQVKTIIATNLISKEKDPDSQFFFFKFGFVIEPKTWFKNICSLRSGNYIIIKNNKVIYEKNWFNLENLWILADKNKTKVTTIDLQKKIYEELNASVKKHLVSDVPIGIFLSSGIDSTIIASLSALNSKKNITAITVLFEDFKGSNYDETLRAKKISKKLGLNHYIYNVSRDDFIKDFPKIIDAMDQPSIDGINVWYASKAAAKLKLKVVFSGLGGDEIFFGYDHFKKISIIYKYFSFIKKFPLMVTFFDIFFKFVGKIKKDDRWSNIVKYSNSVGNLLLLKRTVSKKKYIFEKNKLDIFSNLVFKNKINYHFKNHKIKISLIESICYMKNQLLRDSDWASMYHGVELRTPFVDAYLILKLKNFMNSYSSFNKKKILKLSFENSIPDQFLQKEKTGFQVPGKVLFENYSKKNSYDQKNYLNDYIVEITRLFNKN